MSRVHASAVVLVSMRVRVPDSWGNECTVAQVHQQATRAALDIVSKGGFPPGVDVLMATVEQVGIVEEHPRTTIRRQ